MGGRSRTNAAAAACATAALLAAGCGNPGGDLLALEERPPGGAAPTRLVVTDDGRGSCNGGGLQRLESTRLLEAREVEREMVELPAERSDFGRLEGRTNYRAHMRDADVTWAQGAQRPEVLAKATLLALRLRRELCGR